jgi:hypothetical protein
MAAYSGYWGMAGIIEPNGGLVNQKSADFRAFSGRYCVMFAAEFVVAFASQCSDGCALRRDDGAGEGDALAAFGSATQAGIGAAGCDGAIARDFLQVFFPDGIADTNDHGSLLGRGNILFANGSQ